MLRAARVEQQHRRAVAVEHVLGEGAQRGAAELIRLRRERGAVLDAERGAGPGALGRREVQGALRDLGLGGYYRRWPRRRARRGRRPGDEGMAQGEDEQQAYPPSNHFDRGLLQAVGCGAVSCDGKLLLMGSCVGEISSRASRVDASIARSRQGVAVPSKNHPHPR